MFNLTSRKTFSNAFDLCIVLCVCVHQMSFVLLQNIWIYDVTALYVFWFLALRACKRKNNI